MIRLNVAGFDSILGTILQFTPAHVAKVPPPTLLFWSSTHVVFMQSVTYLGTEQLVNGRNADSHVFVVVMSSLERYESFLCMFKGIYTLII